MRLKHLWQSLGALALLSCGSTDPNPVDSQPPFITITNPVDGAAVNGQVSIDATVVDDFGVDKVRILVDNVLLIELYTAPFHAVWNTSALTDNSTHAIKFEAFDVAGNFRTQQISVTITRGPN